MKVFLITLLVFLFGVTAIGQDITDSGFTNKSEAKNQKIHGLKEGKWIEYLDRNENIIQTKDTIRNIRWISDSDIHQFPWYQLTVYKAGKPYGIQREYYRSGKMYEEYMYSNGKINGESKVYTENGKISSKWYYENSEPISTIFYDENGNEIKTQ